MIFSRLRNIALLTISLMCISFGSLAGDTAAGEALAKARCASCHGAAGISPNELWPNLAGQKAGYLAKQITAFKNSTRKDPMMNAMVSGLTDADISNIAAYYSSIK